MSKNTYVQLLHNQSLQCAEGPVWDGKSETLFWTDSLGKAIFSSRSPKHDLENHVTGLHAAALALHADGGLVFCGAEGIYHLDPDKVLRKIGGACEGIEMDNLNEVIVDPRGRIFSGQEKFKEDNAYAPGYLFRIDLDGTVTIVEEGLHISNGMGFSPGLDKFYLVDSIARQIYCYHFDIATGDISNRKALITISKDGGLPDGIAIDAEGFIWVAQWFGGCISRYDPDGKLERSIDLPVLQPSSLTFGGTDLNEIFITTAAVLWETKLAFTTHDFTRPRGGGIYRIVQSIQGKSDYYALV